MTLSRKAIKKVSIQNYNKEYILNKIVPEIVHLSTFQHENIVKFYEHFSTENYFYIVTEYCQVSSDILLI